MSRRILCLLFTALVFLGAMPAAVFAVEGGTVPTPTALNVTAAASGIAVPALSDNAQAFVRTLFRMPAVTSVGFGDVVILSVLWLCFFIALLGAYRLTPFFEQGVGAWLAAFVTAWLIVAAGVLSAALVWLQGIQKGIQGLTSSALAAWIVVLLVVVFLVYCFFTLFSMVRKKARVDEAEREGVTLGAAT